MALAARAWRELFDRAIAGKGQEKMSLSGKKNSLLLGALLFVCLCVAARPVSGAPALPNAPAAVAEAARLPFAVTASFVRADAAKARLLPGGEGATAFLAVAVAPTAGDVALYASASQATGKVTEARVFADGALLDAPVIFPRGVAKPDPLAPGRTTRMFPDGFTALVPLPEAAREAALLTVKVTGLACSPVNCTPISLTATVRGADAGPEDAWPDAAAAPWWGMLLDGVAELPRPVPASGPGGTVGTGGIGPEESAGAAGTGGSGGLRFAPAPLAVGGVSPGGAGGTEGREGAGAGTVSRPAPDAFLGKLTPVPFSPGLEVASFGKAALLGFLAGIILNLMPCVLPVLGIKLAALLGHGSTAEGIRRFRRHQVFFALGILAWFAAMAGLFHFLDLAWGQIFQSPLVVFLLAVVLLLLALNLFGVFSLPLIDLRAGNTKNPDLRAFGEGFGATLLATPCGGPLLGGVLSWALLQPLGVLALALGCVGLGMAFPYLLLAAFPALARRFPKPGPWMGVMEQVLGFLLLGTVAYLVSFLPAGILPRAVAALVLAAFGGWLWGRGGTVRLLAVACIAAACVWPFSARAESVRWTPYTHADFAAVLGERPVLVDFTADWCATCKVVEATALRDTALRSWIRRHDLALFRVDMTREHPEGEALLRAVGSVSIPVIAVFGTGEAAHAPLVLRDIVTRGQIEAALEKIDNR